MFTSRRRLIHTVLAATLSISLLGGVAQAVDPEDWDSQRAEQQAQADAAAERSQEITAALDSTNANLAAAVALLEETAVAVEQAAAELAAAEREVDRLVREAQILADRLTAAQVEADRITEQIAADTARIEEIRAAIGQLAVSAYKTDPLSSDLAIIFGAETIEEYVTASAMSAAALRAQNDAVAELDEISAINSHRQDRLVAIRDEIAALKVEADAKVVEADAARVVAEEKKAELEALQAEQQQQYDSLAAYREELEAEYAAADAARAEALARIAEINEAEAAYYAAGGGAGQYGLGNPTRFKPFVVTSNFGMRFHPVLHYNRMHWGTDFRSYCGDPIYASQAGVVAWTAYLPGFGNQVMLTHGVIDGASLATSYSHLSAFAVSAGQRVDRGQLVGYSGTTGTSSACHLHFEVLVNGSNVDPMTLLSN
jgi:murein DD-endopeptidase MepM/ murein hydrolase activator NlpD